MCFKVKPILHQLLLVVALAMAITARAAYTDQTIDSLPKIVGHLDSIGNVHINAPDELNARLEKESTTDNSDEKENIPTSTVKNRSGYRVEVFADNNVRTAKVQASNKKRSLQARFPQYGVYLVFEAPFWRVRVGDFTNRSAAESAMAEIRQAMPSLSSSLRVVRSAINQ